MKKLFMSICLGITFLSCTSTANAAFVEYSLNMENNSGHNNYHREQQTHNQQQEQNTYNQQQQNVNPYRHTRPNQSTNNVVPSEPKKVVDSITTSNSANYNVKFMYYIPASLANSNKSFPVIVFVPGLDGDGEECLPENFYEFADQNGFGILTPTFKFDDDDFQKKKAYQYPDAWSGQALVSMLAKAKRNGLNYSKLYMVGFSAGAQFSSRFSFLYPTMIDACAILGSGARVKPTQKNSIKYFVGIGSMDTDYRKENAEIFRQGCRDLGISVQYRQYNAGHDMPEEEITDVLNFFKSVKNGYI